MTDELDNQLTYIADTVCKHAIVTIVKLVNEALDSSDKPEGKYAQRIQVRGLQIIADGIIKDIYNMSCMLKTVRLEAKEGKIDKLPPGLQTTLNKMKADERDKQNE